MTHSRQRIGTLSVTAEKNEIVVIMEDGCITNFVEPGEKRNFEDWKQKKQKPVSILLDENEPLSGRLLDLLMLADCLTDDIDGPIKRCGKNHRIDLKKFYPFALGFVASESIRQMIV